MVIEQASRDERAKRKKARAKKAAGSSIAAVQPLAYLYSGASNLCNSPLWFNIPKFQILSREHVQHFRPIGHCFLPHATNVMGNAL